MPASTLPPARRWLRAGALVALLTTLAWFALRGRAEVPAAPRHAAEPVTATLVQVLRADIPDERQGVGTVRPLASVTVHTRIDGQLERVGFIEGQDVKAGQVLARLDARALRAQLEQAQAQQARDEAQLANARTDLARYTNLIQVDATTRQTLDTQRALVAQLQATLQTDHAQIDFAQVQLAYATISAPIAGRVGARLVDPGNIVHVSDAGGLVVINQIDPIAVEFSLPEDAVPAIIRAQRMGRPLPVLVYPRDGGEPLARGELVMMNNQIDTTSGTVTLKARFANPQHVLWPGQYVDVRLILGEHRQVLTVPDSVVQRSQSGTYAYVVDDKGKAEVRAIRVLLVQQGRALIASGLQAGETVVADGQYKLKPGLVVVAAPVAHSASAAARGPAAETGR